MMTIDDIIKLVNEMPFVEYDITFCDNNECPRRQECHRWQMYRIYKADKRANKPCFIHMNIASSNNCNLFWRWEQITTHE